MIGVISENTAEKVKRYTIMHEENPVLQFNRETDEIKIYDKSLLPFGLRGRSRLSAVSVFEQMKFTIFL